MAFRETRRYKQKGVTVSFGDIMLPLVGIAAIGLLLVAGKLFFLKGVRTERNPLPVVERRETPLPVVPSAKALEELANSSESVHIAEVVAENPFSSVAEAEGVKSVVADVLAEPQRKSESSAPRKSETGGQSVGDKQDVQKRQVGKIAQDTAKKGNAIFPSTVKAVPTPPEKKETKIPSNPPASISDASRGGVWRVQVGAFSVKNSAISVARQLAQEGYKVAVSSGTRFHKVLVQAGTTQQDAARVIAKMEKAGFIGSFALAPDVR